MFPIPPKGSEPRARMIAEHRACIDYMKGVAGCSILRTERPGSAIEPYGGIHQYMDLAKTLVRMRAMQPGVYGGKFVVICTEIDREWRIGRLTGVRGQPPRFFNDQVYTDENEIQHDIFLLRLDQYPITDGMPEDFHEGWKRHDDNWAVT
ncbi:hypothetical protein [Pseudonocardia sp. H11422]|uniref:hypothetical protein n=1 Tax=Pseudonocardia sp. H11422 TaxID=2835866 RepID=UPI001BDD8B0B|nr:hypothetical protein [Pseudonocardia sp. H11422]